MSAGITKGTTHKNNIAYSVNTSQLADCVNNEQGIAFAFATFLLHLRTKAGFVTIMAGKLGNFIGAGSFARCNNQTCVRIQHTYSLKSFQKNLFFTRMGRAGNNYRIILLQAQLHTIPCQILRSHLCIGLVKFGVACHKYLASVCTQMRNIICIDARLHTKARHGIKHIIPDTIKVSVIFNRFFGDAAINHHYRNMAFADGTQKVRPQFCFYRHKYTWMDAFNQRLSHKRKIQWEVDNCICLRNNLLGHIISANSECRNQNRSVRHFLTDLLN